MTLIDAMIQELGFRDCNYLLGLESMRGCSDDDPETSAIDPEYKRYNSALQTRQQVEALVTAPSWRKITSYLAESGHNVEAIWSG